MCGSPLVRDFKDRVDFANAMDEAAKGAKALSSGDIVAALAHYSNAIAANQRAVNYYIQRSTAYTRLSPADHSAALNDAEVALVLARDRQKKELIAEAQLRRGISLFHLGRYEDARQCLKWSQTLNEKGKGLDVWLAKAEAKIPSDEGTTIQEFPKVDIPNESSSKGAKPIETDKPKPSPGAPTSDSNAKKPLSTEAAAAPAAQTTPSRIRHEWYQSADTVTVALLARGVPKDKATINIDERSLNISFPLQNGSDFEFSLDPLFATIDPQASTSKVMSTKVEFYLRKAQHDQKWSSLEGPEDASDTVNMEPKPVGNGSAAASQPQDAPPAYPTSSKSGPKNWDKVANDLSKKPKETTEDGKGKNGKEEEEDDVEEGDPVNGFFKKLYAGADPDTRRAMMKSYQESNGTALSTNWSEVGKGKVETSPPDGMVAKSWGE